MIDDENKLKQPLFNEVQHFRQVWVMFVVLTVAGMQWIATVRQLLLGNPFGQNPMPDYLLLIYWMSFGIGLPILFFYAHLSTEVRTDGVYYRLIPFQRSFRKIAFDDLVHCEQITFHAIREYGGWGIRWRPKGKAYIMSGNQGVQFEIKNGKKILIGTHQIDAFWRLIPERVRQ
jgi:hypothetical protein